MLHWEPSWSILTSIRILILWLFTLNRFVFPLSLLLGVLNNAQVLTWIVYSESCIFDIWP